MRRQSLTPSDSNSASGQVCSVRRAGSLLTILVALGLPWSASAAEPASPLLDRYAFTLGSYFTNTDTDLRVDETRQDLGTRFNFEDDLDFDSSDSLARFEGQFLVGRRHQINAGYYELNRDSSSVLRREITIGDRTFPISADVSGFFDTRIIETSYTYWLVAKDKVVFGLNGGVRNLTIDAGVDVTVGPGVGVDPDLTVDEFVPLIGAEVRTALTKKLTFRAIGQFITASDLGDIKQADVFDFSVGLEHRTFSHAGIGLVYRGLLTELEIEKRLTGGEIGYDIDGIEAFLRFWL